MGLKKSGAKVRGLIKTAAPTSKYCQSGLQKRNGLQQCFAIFQRKSTLDDFKARSGAAYSP